MGKKFSTKTYKGSKDPWDAAFGYQPMCYEAHPPLPVGDFVIYGGSCSRPVVKDADIYIGFDPSMEFQFRKYPWEESEREVVEFLFRISDMSAPKNPDQFKKMVEWVCTQLQDGKKIHAGCIGGHGRTGTFLAAVVKEMTGEADAITYVRDNYCQKAVECSEQVNFLHKYFGIQKVSGAKEGKHSHHGFTTHTPPAFWTGGTTTHRESSTVSPVSTGKAFVPVVSSRCLWGK